MSVTPKILYDSLISRAGVVITPSSEATGFPAANLGKQSRGSRWRSAVGWPVVAGLRDTLLFTTADGTREGHIVPGVYATGALYATAVQAAFLAAGYNPRALPATGWWRADSATLDANGRVSQLTDLSGNNRHLTQSNTALRPLFVANALDGRPGLYFDGTAGMCLASSLSGGTMASFLGANGVGTICMIFRLDSDAASEDVLLVAGSGTQFLIFKWAGGLNFSTIAHDTTNKTATKAAVAGVATWHHAWIRYNQTDIETYVDNVNTAARASTAMTGALHANILASTLTIGDTGGSPVKGYFVEAFTVASALAESIRRGTVHYIKSRYASVAANDASTASSWSVALGVTYAATKFTIARTSGTGNPSLLTLSGVPSIDQVSSAYPDLGFSTSADKTGATSYLSDNAVYQGTHSIRIDALSSLPATVAAALDHNLGTGGAIYLQGNSLDLWNNPPFNQLLTGNTEQVVASFAQQTYRYWRLVIVDPQNIAGYSEISLAPFGVPVDFPAYSNDDLRSWVDYSNVQPSLSGSLRGTSRAKAGLWILDFGPVIGTAEKTIMEAFEEAVPRNKSFLFFFDFATSSLNFVYVNKMEELQFKKVPDSVNIWTSSMKLLENLS